MSRLIWDSDAIDVVCKEFGSVYCWNCANQDTDDCEDCHRKYMNWSISRETVESVINGLTSAEPQWIPCEERLPEARRSVIISTKEWTGEGCYWETTPNHIIWKGYRWNATYWDDEVTAWMPLPKPYEGRTE